MTNFDERCQEYMRSQNKSLDNDSVLYDGLFDSMPAFLTLILSGTQPDRNILAQLNRDVLYQFVTEAASYFHSVDTQSWSLDSKWLEELRNIFRPTKINIKDLYVFIRDIVMHMKSCEINSIREHNEIIKESMRALQPELTEAELNRKMSVYIAKIKAVIQSSRKQSARKSERIREIRKENRNLDADEAYMEWQKEQGKDTYEDIEAAKAMMRETEAVK